MNIMLFIPVSVTVVGIYLMLKLGSFIFKPRRLFADVRTLLSKRGAARNLSLALAGTLGVGNIVGVAVGIRVGGAGSVFWLVVSAFPAAAIKYAESSIALDSSGRGIADAARTAFPRCGGRMSFVYSVCVFLLSLAMGAGLQSASFSESVASVLPIRTAFFGAILAALTLPVLFFGMRRIKDATALFVTSASIIYVVMSVYIIFLSRENLPEAISEIMSGAFSGRGVIGGAAATLTSHALREGFCRGILSNEAGLGTSAMAHASDSEYTPHEAGLVGVLEVFLDTLVLCPLTALMLLVAGDASAEGAVDYVLSAVRSGGAALEYVFVAAIFFFAFSTVICWSAYGRTAFCTFCPRGEWLFRLLFLLAVALGGVMGSETFVSAVDVIMLPLAAVSLLTVIKSSDRVLTLSEKKKRIKADVSSKGSAHRET